MAWPTFPTALDCVAGSITPGSKPALLTSAAGFDQAYYNNRIGELRRLPTNTPAGSIPFLGCSFLDYSSLGSITPYGVNIGIAGNELRAVLDMLTGPMAPLFQNAGAVVLVGLIANAIRIETNHESGNAAYALQNIELGIHQLSNLLTGKGVICKAPPINNSAAPLNVTNARIAAVNGYIQTHFWLKPGWEIVDVNSQLVDSTGQLDAQYTTFDGVVDGCHLNAAGWTILATGIRSALGTIGVQ